MYVRHQMMTYVHDVTKVIRSVGWYDMVIGVIDSNPKEDSRRVKNNEMRLDENCLFLIRFLASAWRIITLHKKSRQKIKINNLQLKPKEDLTKEDKNCQQSIQHISEWKYHTLKWCNFTVVLQSLRHREHCCGSSSATAALLSYRLNRIEAIVSITVQLGTI
jgi:hypothetical protein